MEKGNQSGDLAISGGHGNAQEEYGTPWEEEDLSVLELDEVRDRRTDRHHPSFHNALHNVLQRHNNYR